MLHHLSFEVRPGEKVGVLGRTGSGKSTLALSFFRFVEPVEGRILIDGLNIAKMGLTDLRSKLTIIPRECVATGPWLACRALRPVPFRMLLIPCPTGAPQRTPRFSVEHSGRRWTCSMSTRTPTLYVHRPYWPS